MMLSKWIFYIFVSAVTGYNLHSLKKECPPPESILKCSCKLKTGPQVWCGPFEADIELQNAIKGLKGYSIKKLQISSINASTLSTGAFQGLHVDELTLDKFEVADASFRRGHRHFQGLENSLSSLEIKKSFRRGDRPLLNLELDHMKLLKVVLMEDNSIPEVGDDWFRTGPINLEYLMLERNGIEVLGKTAFRSLQNLKLLAVAGNHFRDVTRSMFPEPAVHLNNLDLAYNKIRELPEDLFSKMPSLREVNLDYNLIHTLPETSWSLIISHLDSLQLEGNPLNCDEKLKWLCRAKMAGVSGKCLEPLSKRGLTLRKFCAS